MVRVKVIVEGQTEESFINDVLRPVLWPHEVFLYPLIVGSPGHKGGNTKYVRVKRDIVAQLRQDPTSYCSTMLDYYGLGSGFPGTPAPPDLTPIEKVLCIEQAVLDDFISTVPELRPESRFLPYLQLHEYEGLLFSNPVAFANGITQPRLAQHFQAIRSQFHTPEDINDDVDSAPSKRVLDAHGSYRKPVDGILAAKAVGIEAMRRECPHFHQWIEHLEALAVSSQ